MLIIYNQMRKSYIESNETERVQNQEALRESEERYRNIIEYSNDMIWTLDTEGRFLFFNKVSEEITGFKLEDWRGKSFAPLIKKEELPKSLSEYSLSWAGRFDTTQPFDH